MKSRIIEAVGALERFDREGAVAMLKAELADRSLSPGKINSILRLAQNIGQIDLEIDASRRLVEADPRDLKLFLEHSRRLAEYGAAEEAKAHLAQLPVAVQNHPGVDHFLGTLATQTGRFSEAEDHFRSELSKGFSPQAWHALAMIKKFTPEDPDLQAMWRGLPQVRLLGGRGHAAYAYAMAKALEDCGDLPQAFEFYGEGARIRRAEQLYDPAKNEARIDEIIATYAKAFLDRLKPSGEGSDRAIFVTGLPRSGTTLTEQILTAHSQVVDGAEINLFRPSLTSMVGSGRENMLRFDDTAGDDPWGKLGRTYLDLVSMRFGQTGRIVDKTLLHSSMMAQIVHALPNAPIIWLRRDPRDVATSNYRTYFTSDIPWSWDLGDIGHFMRQEDRLFDHFQQLFGERILAVRYEDMVSAPDEQISRLALHARLPLEPAMLRPHEQTRTVRTASVSQVRAPISTSAVGKSSRYEQFLEPFLAQYYR